MASQKGLRSPIIVFGNLSTRSKATVSLIEAVEAIRSPTPEAIPVKSGKIVKV